MKKKLKNFLRRLIGYRHHSRFGGINEIRYNYSAFISYYQIPDKSFADALQRSLRILGSKWYLLKFRALEVFRDETDTSGFVSLKKKIVAGIDQSEFLILLASKTGKERCVSEGKKDWVADEIDYWLNSRHARELSVGEKLEQLKIIICVTDGSIRWDGEQNDFDWEETNCLPEILKNKFSETPLWVDLTDIKNADVPQQSNLSVEFPSFKQKVAEISAQIQNVSVERANFKR